MEIFKFLVGIISMYLLFCCIFPKKGMFFISDVEQRKRWYAIVGWVVLFVVSGVIYDNSDEGKEDRRKAELEKAKNTAGSPEWYRVRIDSARLDSAKLANMNADTMKIEEMELPQLLALAKICKVHYANPNKEELNNDTLLALYTFNRGQCERLFRSCEKRLRKRYAALCGSLLWEHDIEVKVTGKNSDCLWLTGGMLAANKNKKAVQETIAESVRMLGFKRVCYKWYEYDDKYTYWDIE